MLGKGLESLIPAGGYQKPSDQSSQNNNGFGMPINPLPSLNQGGEYSVSSIQESTSANNHLQNEYAPSSFGYQDLRPATTTNPIYQPAINNTTLPTEVKTIEPNPSLTVDISSPVTIPSSTEIIMPSVPTSSSLATETIVPINEAPITLPAESIVTPTALITSPIATPPTTPVTTVTPIPGSVFTPSITPAIASTVESISLPDFTPVPTSTPTLAPTITPILNPSPVFTPSLTTAIDSTLRPISPSDSTFTSTPISTSMPAPAPISSSVSNPVFTPPLSPSAHIENTKPILKDDMESDYSRRQASVFHIEVEKIFPNPHQPRRHFDEDALNELANSIREFGVIQPLVVTKTLTDTEVGTNVSYQLIAGERRLMAAKKVGLRTVPVVIRQVMMDRERLELAIIENIQRENLNPLESARGYAKLQDEFGLTQREIAIRIGKSRETIANSLRLLNLPSEIQQALSEGKINESHARLLLQINDISRQKDMFQSILRVKPSVRALKETIKRDKSFTNNYLNPELVSLQSKLEEFLGTKAEINDDGGRGKITINYYSPEELSALIHRLSGEMF